MENWLSTNGRKMKAPSTCKRRSSVNSGAWLWRFVDVTGVAKTDILRWEMRTRTAVKMILLQKVSLHYGERSLFWSLMVFPCLSFTTVGGQKIGFNSCECTKLLHIANFQALDVWGKRIIICNNKIFFLCFFLFIPFATQLFSTPVTSSKLRKHAPLFTELRL